MKEPKSVLVKITGQWKLIITVAISVLADGKKLTHLLLWTHRMFHRETPLVECYLNVMRKSTWQKNSWSNGWEKYRTIVKCSAKENCNADLKCLQGLLKQKLSTSNLNTNQETTAGDMASHFHALDVKQGQPHLDGERTAIWKIPSTTSWKHKQTYETLLGQWMKNTAWNDTWPYSIIKRLKK